MTIPEKMSPRWTNNKNGNVYMFLGFEINCTNEQDGQLMVRYEPRSAQPDDIPYTREYQEFLKKFTPYLG